VQLAKLNFLICPSAWLHMLRWPVVSVVGLDFTYKVAEYFLNFQDFSLSRPLQVRLNAL
jgi:hypothetical protein